MSENLYANINGVKICYDIFGKDDKDPIILVHGFGSKKETWMAQVDALAKAFKVIRLDNRGAGKSERPDEPFTIQTLADDLRGFMDFLQIEKAHLIGWSLGGMIAQQFSLMYPERVKKIVLINTTYKVSGASGDTDAKDMYVKMRLKKLEFIKKDPEKAFWFDVRAGFHEDFRKQMEADKKRKFFGIWSVQDLIEYISTDPPTPRDIENQALALDNFNTLERLCEIKHDTLLITASHDRLTPKSIMEEMHERIPNSILKVIYKAGHSSPLSNAPEINQLIVDFLKD